MNIRPEERLPEYAEQRQPELRAQLARLEEENLMLRRALAERSLAPATRRIVGRTIGVAVVVVSLSLLGWFMFHDATRDEVRDALRSGYERGSLAGASGARPAAPAAPAAATPATPAAPAAPARPAHSPR